MEKPATVGAAHPLFRWLADHWLTVRARLARSSRSLRLRLAMWYGGLLAIMLAIFAVLVILATTQALDASVRGAIEAEARVAMLDVRQRLSPAAPYWPSTLALPAVDAYRDPGVTVDVIGPNGHLLYHSGTDGATSLPGGQSLVNAALRGGTAWATLRIGGESIRAEALPIYPPTPNDASSAQAQSAIGVLLVAKSLRDVDETLALLRMVLIIGAILLFVAALVGGWAIAGRVLRPLAELGATASSIVAATRRGKQLGGLSRRVPHPGGSDELARVVDTVNEMLASLEQANRTQRRFVADASHELRAPLTTIQGNLALLQRRGEDFPPEERQQMLVDAYAETLGLARLVDDLLLLARADAQAGERTPPAGTIRIGTKRATRGAVEVDREIVQLVRSLRGRLRAEGRSIALEIEHIEPVRVYADQETIRRVALILIDNAIKYTPEASDDARTPPGRVTVSLRREGHEAVLSVADTGVGIAPEDLPHIFERFYRADQARDRAGTGLGLAIAAELIDHLGGTITVESTPGHGSTFRVRLSLAQPAVR